MKIWLLPLICLPLAGNTYGKLPLSFEPNQGQTDARVKFLARVPGYTLFVTADAVVFAGHDGLVERMKVIGANQKMRVEPLEQQPGVSNYFIGNDPVKWRTNIPNYGRVALRGVYPGIDLVFYGNDRQIEYDWVVAPGADPKRIRVKWDGTNHISKNSAGDLVLSAALKQQKPLISQDGKQVGGSYAVRGRQVTFDVAKYDTTKPLVIDPVLIYSTYDGGVGIDYAYATAVDAIGNTYMTGGTGSVNFPTANPLQASLQGTVDVFVTKINATGSARVYSTYLGGGGPDEGRGIAVDIQGNAYLTGNAGSFDFPTAAAIQGTWGGSGDVFVTKLNPSGSALVYSTYLGGNAIDNGNGIAVDPSGNAYVVGTTFSTNFPTVNPFQGAKSTVQDAFVAKINPGGTAWVYATYLGGNAVDEGNAIAADATGNAYVTGYTASTNFPLQSAFRGSNVASVDAFVTKLNSAGSALVYSTYLGGSATDYGTGIAVDSSGSAYVTGIAGSSDFPVANAMQPMLAGADDAFVTKFNSAGSALAYSTYLGGGSVDQAYAIAIDHYGNSYVTGRTNSSDFPLTNAIQGTFKFAFDIFVTELNTSGSGRIFSTFTGGTGSEEGYGIAVDLVGNIHIVGATTSTDFPVLNPLQGLNGGGSAQDAIMMLIGDSSPLISAAGVLRDTAGGIRLSRYPSASLSNSGGVFASDPAVAQDLSGNTFVAARDSSNAIWTNVFNPGTSTWAGWQLGGGATAGVPAIAVAPNGTAWIAARDAFGSYWLVSYTAGVGYGAWVPLGGFFNTDPVITACGDGSVYVAGLSGVSNFAAVYTGRYLPGSGFQNWAFDGGGVAGKISTACGKDNAVYLVARDSSNSSWIGRVSGNTLNGWFNGGAQTTSDPRIAALGGSLAVVILDAGGAVWRNTFTEGSANGWQSWTGVGGGLSDISPVALNGELFFIGKAPNNDLWWWRQTGSLWTWISNNGVAAGALAAAPK